jgi:hypothetical protein
MPHPLGRHRFEVYRRSCHFLSSASNGEGIVQAVVKATQTRIRWCCVRLTEGPPIKKDLEVKSSRSFLLSR